MKTKNEMEINNINDESDTVQSEIPASLTFWKVLAYFIIFSFFGFLIEMIYCVITWGIVQIRQTFLYGPFCCVYGTGAIFIILSLRHFKKSKLTLFLLGFLVGSMVEYLLSYIGELFFNMRWWDYSHEFFNLNGRICLLYSLFWGILSVIIISFIMPIIDKFLDYLKHKLGIIRLKAIVFAISVFMLLDCLLAIFALNMFMTRLIKIYNLELQYPEITLNICTRLYDNSTINNIVYKLFDDEKMMISFPNLRALDKDGNIVDTSSLLPEVKNYYFRIYEK